MYRVHVGKSSVLLTRYNEYVIFLLRQDETQHCSRFGGTRGTNRPLNSLKLSSQHTGQRYFTALRQWRNCRFMNGQSIGPKR